MSELAVELNSLTLPRNLSWENTELTKLSCALERSHPRKSLDRFFRTMLGKQVATASSDSDFRHQAGD